ncbi:hypothetical protein Tco_0760158 [Tanacetum coccineum]
MNTKLSKPSTSGTKLYPVTSLPKSKVIPKVIEKNDLSKIITSHLTTNKIIEKCTKVLTPGHASKFAERIQELLVNDRIQQTSSRSKKNKVEAQLRKSKSSLNKNNHVSNCNPNIKNVALSKNSTNVCLSCNECLFSANHDACVVKYLKDVQKHKKAKSVKQKEKFKWKLTGRMYKTIGLKWTGKFLLPQ